MPGAMVLKVLLLPHSKGAHHLLPNFPADSKASAKRFCTSSLSDAAVGVVSTLACKEYTAGQPGAAQ